MIDVTPSGAALGAYVTGIDLAAGCTADDVATIRKAWLEHLVLAFPDQALTPVQYLDFARTLGTPVPYPFVAGIDGFPEIIEVKKLPDEKQNFGGVWHSDTAYLDRPPMASMLIARTVPEIGGDTEFANQYLAYETLEADMRARLDGLRAVNTSALADDIRVQGDRISAEDKAQVFEAVHPVVRRHPETDRRSLFVNVAHTETILDIDEAESRDVLQHLFEHQVRPELVWRLEWEPATLAVWDNRCTLHNPINDYGGHLRLMHRITLEGEVPV